jgi:uncharacterized protein YdaU (DUF1376 family)
MHYYQFNIGDYQSHTSHLSETEDLAYRRMLDWCYLHEKPLPVDPEEISRLVRMRTHSESIAIVLREYFELRDEGWINLRVIQEILKVGIKSEKASESAKARWSKPKDANALPTQSERYATQDTLPKTQDTKPKKTTIEAPAGVTPETWAAFVQQRKTKKAQITQLVLDSITKQASLASWSLEDALKEIVVRNWTSFNAEWVKGKPKNDFMKGLI